MKKLAFKRGINNTPIRHIRAVRKELMAALGITTRPALLARIKGDVEPKVSEVEKIEEVFARYGIVDVWGEE
jgi:predicted transcriptional regulator